MRFSNRKKSPKDWIFAIRKLYNSIASKSIWQGLKNMRVTEKVIELTKICIENPETRYRPGNNRTETFSINKVLNREMVCHHWSISQCWEAVRTKQTECSWTQGHYKTKLYACQPDSRKRQKWTKYNHGHLEIECVHNFSTQDQF